MYKRQEYCEATSARQSIRDNFSWFFSGDDSGCPIPLCTQLISPENNDTDVPINTNLSWEPVLYALNGYKVTVRASIGGDILVEEVVTDTSYEFEDDFEFGEVVSVTITPFNNTGDALTCAEESFTVATTPPTTPECTMLVSTLAGATNVPVNTNLSWVPVADADNYFISIGTSSGATDFLNNVDVGNITTYDFEDDLPEGETFYVTIRPNNEVGLSTGCNEDSFTTEIIPVVPICTTLISPANNATDVLKDAVISWNAVDNAKGYLVSIGTISEGVDVANSINVEGATMITIAGGLPENETLYVTITPYNDVGDAIACTEESFSTDTV